MIDQCKENGELKEEEDNHNLFILFGDRAGEEEYQREEGHSFTHSLSFCLSSSLTLYTKASARGSTRNSYYCSAPVLLVLTN